MAELHKLNITLSNYFDVAPTIVGSTMSTTPEAKTTHAETRSHIV